MPALGLGNTIPHQIDTPAVGGGGGSGFLLMESASFLLLEDGVSKFILE